eukprot:Lankesteria_metandrocarpae@DN5339_c0_g1_i3.p1
MEKQCAAVEFRISTFFTTCCELGSALCLDESTLYFCNSIAESCYEQERLVNTKYQKSSPSALRGPVYSTDVWLQQLRKITAQYVINSGVCLSDLDAENIPSIDVLWEKHDVQAVADLARVAATLEELCFTESASIHALCLLKWPFMWDAFERYYSIEASKDIQAALEGAAGPSIQSSATANFRGFLEKHAVDSSSVDDYDSTESSTVVGEPLAVYLLRKAAFTPTRVHSAICELLCVLGYKAQSIDINKDVTMQRESSEDLTIIIPFEVSTRVAHLLWKISELYSTARLSHSRGENIRAASNFPDELRYSGVAHHICSTARVLSTATPLHRLKLANCHCSKYMYSSTRTSSTSRMGAPPVVHQYGLDCDSIIASVDFDARSDVTNARLLSARLLGQPQTTQASSPLTLCSTWCAIGALMSASGRTSVAVDAYAQAARACSRRSTYARLAATMACSKALITSNLSMATELLEECRRADHSTVALLAIEVQVYFEKGEMEKATKLAKIILDRTSLKDSGNLHEVLGLCARVQGNKISSVEHFRKAHSLVPRDPQLLYRLSTVLFELEQYQDCAHFAEKAVHLQPSEPELHYLLGQAYVALLQTTRAITQFVAAMEFARSPSIKAALRDCLQGIASKEKRYPSLHSLPLSGSLWPNFGNLSSSKFTTLATASASPTPACETPERRPDAVEFLLTEAQRRTATTSAPSTGIQSSPASALRFQDPYPHRRLRASYGGGADVATVFAGDVVPSTFHPQMLSNPTTSASALRYQTLSERVNLLHSRLQRAVGSISDLQHTSHTDAGPAASGAPYEDSTSQRRS